MKQHFNYFIFFIFTATIFIILLEISSIIRYHTSLSSGKIGLPTKSNTYSLAIEEPKMFLESQLSATHYKLRNVTSDLIKNILFILIALCFLNPMFNEKVINLCENNITLVKQNFRSLKRKEINFISIMLFSYLSTVLMVSLIKSKNVEFQMFFSYLCLFILAYFLLIPLLIFLLFIVISKFGKKFIIACYIAYSIKILPELLMEDKIDHSKMIKMKIEEFPDEIQDVLRKYDLQESVYKERKPGRDMNAALIGYGIKKRMEIYGDLDTYSKDQLFSIFLHEIGHVDEHSLLRKSIVYFIVLLIELLIILLIYEKVAHKYTTNTISFFTSFVMLVFIYRIVLRQWLISANKIVSQLSEINSDLFTKKFHYNDSLALTLYEIGVDAEDYLIPTRMYNSLRSTHPSIFSRVEYLS